MTIKKPNAEVSEMPTAMPTGSATIADRFKLDLTDPNAKKAGSGKLTTVTLVAGLLALAVVGVLTFIIYNHWSFLEAA